MSGWVVPALFYIVLLGSLGVTTRLALDHVSWQDIIVWTTVVYICIAAVMLALGQATIGFGPGTVAAVASGVLASTALIALYIALGRGQASIVVPFTSAYPLVTVGLSALVLAEKVTAFKAGGALLVVAGAMLISASE
jgi:transporter family protein